MPVLKIQLSMLWYALEADIKNTHLKLYVLRGQYAPKHVSVQEAGAAFLRETLALTSLRGLTLLMLHSVSGSYFPFKGHPQQNLTGGDTDRLQIWSFLV